MSWVRVFKTLDEIDEAFKGRHLLLVQVGDRNICLSKFNHQFFATSDYCPHNKEKLHKGTINHLGEVICPWHNYRYRLDNGRECEQRTKDLETYRVKTSDEGLFIKV